MRLPTAEARYYRALRKVDTYESESGSAQLLAIKLRKEIWDFLAGMYTKAFCI